MAYELAIPFRTFYSKSFSAADSSKVFGLTIVIKAMSMPQSGSYSRGMRPGGGRPGGNGGMGGGMGQAGGYGGGRMQGGNAADRQSMFEENTIRAKFRLSTF